MSDSTIPYLTSYAGAHLFLMRDNKVFMIRRANTMYRDGEYSVPAGHINEGETVTEAVVREACEESGVTLKPEDLSFVHVLHHIQPIPSQKSRMQFFFRADMFEGEPKNTEPEKCDHADWFSLDDLPKPCVP
jgi:8-oxo-dGTP diphosphatase